MQSVQKGSESIDCFICNQTFKTRNELMIHRKSTHIRVVKKCEKFNQNSCSFSNDSCWFLHEFETKGEENEESISTTEQGSNNSDFHNTHWNQKPPFKNLNKKQKIE